MRKTCNGNSKGRDYPGKPIPHIGLRRCSPLCKTFFIGEVYAKPPINYPPYLPQMFFDYKDQLSPLSWLLEILAQS